MLIPSPAFSSSEIRLATIALCAITAVIPLSYYLYNSSVNPQKSTRHMRTFHKFLKGYSTLRPQALAADASADFTHTAMPADLKLPSRSLEPFKQHASMIFSLFTDFTIVPQPEGSPNSVNFSPDTSTVIAHCKMGGKVNSKSPNGAKLVSQGYNEWWNECVIFVQMDSSGRKIVEVREFLHSAKAQELKGILTGMLES